MCEEIFLKNKKINAKRFLKQNRGGCVWEWRHRRGIVVFLFLQRDSKPSSSRRNPKPKHPDDVTDPKKSGGKQRSSSSSSVKRSVKTSRTGKKSDSKRSSRFLIPMSDSESETEVQRETFKDVAAQLSDSDDSLSDLRSTRTKFVLPKIFFSVHFQLQEPF